MLAACQTLYSTQLGLKNQEGTKAIRIQFVHRYKKFQMKEVVAKLTDSQLMKPGSAPCTAGNETS